jgi:PAS domain S-box-containing protein
MNERDDGRLQAKNLAAKLASRERPGSGASLDLGAFVAESPEPRAAQSESENEERYRRIAESTSEGVLHTSSAGEILFVTPRFAELLGYAPSALIGRKLCDFMDADAREQMLARLDRRRDGVAESYEHPLRRRDGREIWLRFSSTPFADRSGAIVGAFALVLDVTERREHDEERRRLAGIFEVSGDAIITTDLAGLVTGWNRGATRIFGYAPEEVLNRPFSMLLPPEHADQDEWICALVAGGGSVDGHETMRRRRNGSLVPISLLVYPIHDGSGRIVGATRIARDLTEVREVESALRDAREKLRQAQKMEAVGRLAGGIAHDFNNLLTVILSYADLALGSLPPDEPVRSDLEQIALASHKAADLTRQLLAFSRTRSLAPQLVDVHQSVRGIATLLARILGEDIELTLPAERPVGKIHADPGQIEQVIMNLVINARDAMPDGGKLTLATTDVVLGEAEMATLPGVIPGRYVRLTVTDTGVGMDAATAARIFEPFYTTKEVGKGTGLGLATVLEIVTHSGGRVSVRSEPGAGTTVSVDLPCSDRPAAAVVKAPRAPAPRRGSETILVVDDDDDVRAVARTILRGQGYSVLEARDGAEALEVCQVQRAPIHLLLTDAVMPRISGRQVAAELAQLGAPAKVLLMSGYANTLVDLRGPTDDAIAYLPKPFTPAELTSKVREVLDAPSIEPDPTRPARSS